eukprot:PITA_35206
MGKINFVRRLTPNFVELVKDITSMLKKGSEIKWTDVARSSFEAIKQAIMEAPTLINPDYTKELYIFSFPSYDTLAAILLQKNDEGIEHPMAFFNKTLRDVEPRHDLIEKQAYALIKSLKEFKIYSLHSKVIAYVPLASLKYVLTQLDIDGKRAKWIAKFTEFNIERFAGRQQLKSLPLKLVHTNGPFQQWGLDFIGEINPHSSGQHKWILVATNYFTKWIEVIPTKNVDHQVVIKFLNENIFTRFVCPTKLVTDNAATFKAKQLVDMTKSMGIQLVHSTSYYPQGNGLGESSKNILVRIIKKLCEDNKKSWDSKLKFALWADRVTNKKSIGNSPFKLVYGTDVVSPI